MGFDLYIQLKMMMCPETGKPFYYGKNFEKVYEVPEFTIPEPLRKYLVGRGRHFFPYIHPLNARDRMEADLEEFLENYPEWREVVEDEYYDESWTMEDHDTFADLLEYLHTLPCSFSVSWSY